MNKSIRLLIVLAVLLLLASPALAQEDTTIVIARDDLYSLLSIGGFVFGLVALVLVGISKRQSPQQLDQSVSLRLEAEQRNREHMDRYERLYQQSLNSFKPLVDAAALGLRVLAPLTPMKTDDAAASLLADIQTPGKPVDLKPAAPAPKVEY